MMYMYVTDTYLQEYTYVREYDLLLWYNPPPILGEFFFTFC